MPRVGGGPPVGGGWNACIAPCWRKSGMAAVEVAMEGAAVAVLIGNDDHARTPASEKVKRTDRNLMGSALVVGRDRSQFL